MSWFSQIGDFLGDWGGAIGGAASGALSYFGQNSANQTNRDIATQNNQWNWNQSMVNNAFNANEAEKARQFSERMSGTSFQRGIADMQAAGINPILAFGKGGASTPSASQASGNAIPGQTGAPMVNPMAGATAAFNSALNARSNNLMLENLKADLFKKTEDANLSRAMQRTQDAERTLKITTAKNLQSQLPSIQAESQFGKNMYGAATRMLTKSSDLIHSAFAKDKAIRFNRSHFNR